MTIAMKRAGGIAVGVTLVLLVAWFLLVFRPQSSTLSKAHKEHAQSEQQLAGLQTQEASLKAIYAHKAQDEAAYSILNGELPDTPDLAGAIDEINSAAASSGFAVKTLNPTAPTPSTSGSKTTSGVPAVAITISGAATYPEATQFLTDLAKSPRTFVVTSVQMSGGSKGPLSVDIACSIYYAQ